MHWKEFWDEYPGRAKETEFMRQVGKTVAGQPISEDQFEHLLGDVRKTLDLGTDDRVLDLCCGNGVITAAIAKDCASIVGIDYSAPLIAIARKYNQPPTATYHCTSVLDPGVKEIVGKPFSKIYMYEALQHFGEPELPPLLRLLTEVSNPDAIIMFGSIPDADRIWNFYDTPERQADYRKRKSENREAIGTWWEQEMIGEIARRQGFHATFLRQDPILHTAHYRFDVRLTRPMMGG